MQQFTLERSQFFPYLAWTLIIGFALFVGSLTLELRHSVLELEQITLNTTNALTPAQ